MSAYQLLIIELVMGIISFVFTCCSLIPQIISLRKTRNSSGISLVSNVICNIDNIFWLIWTYGFYFNSMLMYQGNTLRLFQISLLVLVFGYTFGCTLAAYLLFIKIYYLNKAKAYKVTELQLSKILLDKDKKKYFIDKKWSSFRRYFFPVLYILLDLIVSFGIVSILYIFAYVKPDKKTTEWIWVIVFSFISSIIWEIVCWPQLIKSIREKDTTGLSLFWCVFGAVNCIVSFIYDLSLAFGSGKFNYDVLFIIIFSAIAPNLGVMIIKIKNIVKAKKNGMTEMEYTKKVLIPLVKAKRNKHKTNKKVD